MKDNTYFIAGYQATGHKYKILNASLTTNIPGTKVPVTIHKNDDSVVLLLLQDYAAWKKLGRVFYFYFEDNQQAQEFFEKLSSLKDQNQDGTGKYVTTDDNGKCNDEEWQAISIGEEFHPSQESSTSTYGSDEESDDSFEVGECPKCKHYGNLAEKCFDCNKEGVDRVRLSHCSEGEKEVGEIDTTDDYNEDDDFQFTQDFPEEPLLPSDFKY